MLPPLLILAAIACAAATAWGCDPSVVDWTGGIGIIRFMYRLQWLFIGATVASALLLVGLVVTNQRRGWWLIGLAPVLALFVWRFGVSPDRPGAVDDQPSFVHANQVGWIDDNDEVIGLQAAGQAYAFPLAALHHAPVVVMTERDRRMIVCWSAGSGVASACWVDRTVRGRDLRVVTSPHGVLLICNSRIGEFFDALSLRQSGGVAITGFIERVAAERVPWGQWKSMHGETLVLQPRWPLGPARSSAVAQAESVIYIASDPPIIVFSSELASEPKNVAKGASAALLYRDGGFGPAVALDRRIDHDLFPRFVLNADKKRKRVSLLDNDTGSGWTWGGECVDGPMKGSRLKRLIVVENVPAEAARFWVR